MNKQGLAKRVAEKMDNAPVKTGMRAVDAVFEAIAEGLHEDGIVDIGKWGTYEVEKKATPAKPKSSAKKKKPASK